MKWIAAMALLGAVAFVLVKIHKVAGEIQHQSVLDEARPSDAIIVLGAAEYRGKPSPVLEARLNHALYLYLEGMAPRIITTGGAGGDPVFTEGSVGRAYSPSVASRPKPSWWSAKPKAPPKVSPP